MCVVHKMDKWVGGQTFGSCQTAETVLAGQSASEESRPKLVEQLEAFFQDADLTEAKAAAGPIIKLFQQEIDQLDSR